MHWYPGIIATWKMKYSMMWLSLYIYSFYPCSSNTSNSSVPWYLELNPTLVPVTQVIVQFPDTWNWNLSFPNTSYSSVPWYLELNPTLVPVTQVIVQFPDTWKWTLSFPKKNAAIHRTRGWNYIPATYCMRGVTLANGALLRNVATYGNYSDNIS